MQLASAISKRMWRVHGSLKVISSGWRALNSACSCSCSDFGPYTRLSSTGAMLVEVPTSGESVST
jgi:hypothetical protein